MTVVLAAAVGFLAARLLWLLLARAFSSPAMSRTNHRGAMVPTGAGVVLVLAAGVVEGLRVLAESAGVGGGPAAGGGVALGPARGAVLVAVLGFGLLGLLDDVAGSPDARGFRGHLGALSAGRLTTGGMKMVGGGAVALVAVAVARPDTSTGQLIADAALVAAAGNVANLLDRAPGRAIKGAAAGFAVVAIATVADAVLAPAAAVVGAGLGLLPDDLRERLMLGDAGANPLGAVVGLAVVLTATPAVRLLTLAAVAGLNVAGELVSFSRVIDAVPPLRALDRAGRRP